MRSLVVATYGSVRLTPRFLLPAGRHGAALHLDLFEQPALAGCFSTPCWESRRLLFLPPTRAVLRSEQIEARGRRNPEAYRYLPSERRLCRRKLQERGRGEARGPPPPPMRSLSARR